MNYKKHPNRLFRHILSAPFIYMMIIPSVFLDICLEIYHRVSFVLYGIPFVKRGRYIKIDRHKLSYLNLLQKVHCMYCGYVNGLYAYAVAVAGETEKYWCGIAHGKEHTYVAEHQKNFLAYNDKKAYQQTFESITYKSKSEYFLIFSICLLILILIKNL